MPTSVISFFDRLGHPALFKLLHIRVWSSHSESPNHRIRSFYSGSLASVGFHTPDEPTYGRLIIVTVHLLVELRRAKDPGEPDGDADGPTVLSFTLAWPEFRDAPNSP